MIFEYGEHKWRKDIGKDVKLWVNERLEDWLDDEPKWFTDVVKVSIPEWCVDDKNLFQCLRPQPDAPALIETTKVTTVRGTLPSSEDAILERACPQGSY